jgi:hypothetical protein
MRTNRHVCPRAPVKHRRYRKPGLDLSSSSSSSPRRRLWPTSVTITEEVIDAATMAAESDAKIVLDATTMAAESDAKIVIDVLLALFDHGVEPSQ